MGSEAVALSRGEAESELDAAALEVECPACGAESGAACSTDDDACVAAPDGRFHGGRLAHGEDLLREREMAQEWAEVARERVCPHPECAAAAAGVPCVGLPVGQNHPVRLAVALAAAGETREAHGLCREAVRHLGWGECPTCGAKGQEHCQTLLTKRGCNEHDARREKLRRATAWAWDPVEAAEAAWLAAGLHDGSIACPDCLNAGHVWCDTCSTVKFPRDNPRSWAWACPECKSALPHRTGGEWCVGVAAARAERPVFALSASPATKRKGKVKPAPPVERRHDGPCLAGEYGCFTKCPACVGAYESEEGMRGEWKAREAQRAAERAAALQQEPYLHACPDCGAEAGRECYAAQPCGARAKGRAAAPVRQLGLGF